MTDRPLRPLFPKGYLYDTQIIGVLLSADGEHDPDILFIKVPEGKTVKNRMHFDVCPTDREQAEEVDRLLALGARRSSIVGSGSWVVLEDPEGNEFCVMSKRIPPEPAPFHDS